MPVFYGKACRNVDKHKLDDVNNSNLYIKIAPRTQNGQKIRLTGCGLVQNNKIGDIILTVEIKIPTNISEEEINLYKQLESLANKSLRNL